MRLSVQPLRALHSSLMLVLIATAGCGVKRVTEIVVTVDSDRNRFMPRTSSTRSRYA